jgi:hypothetical protein
MKTQFEDFDGGCKQESIQGCRSCTLKEEHEFGELAIAANVKETEIIKYLQTVV